MQMDVIHKHKDVLKSLRIQGFSGLQGALLQNFSAMEKLEIYTSRVWLHPNTNHGTHAHRVSLPNFANSVKSVP